MRSAIGLIFCVLAHAGSAPDLGAALDSGARRLYLPAPNSVQVVDLEGRKLGEVPDLPGVQSVGLAPELGIGFTSNRRSNTVSIFNLATLREEKRLRTTGAEPAAILFDPASRRIFAFNERGRNATAFDAFGGAVAGSIPLGGRPGPAVADGAGTLYASVGDRGEIVLVDARKLVVTQRWDVPGLEHPVGLALDAERWRLYVAGQDGRLGILDSRTGTLLATLALGASLAGVTCDPGTGRLYAASGEGALTVVAADGADPFKAGASLAALPGLRAMVLDPLTHRLYLPFFDMQPLPLNPDSRSLVVPIRISRDDEWPGFDGIGSSIGK